jgi:hypothetical protein
MPLCALRPLGTVLVLALVRVLGRVLTLMLSLLPIRMLLLMLKLTLMLMLMLLLTLTLVLMLMLKLKLMPMLTRPRCELRLYLCLLRAPCFVLRHLSGPLMRVTGGLICVVRPPQSGGGTLWVL